MTYSSRIRVNPEYLFSLGRAFYNFTYFEWIVVCLIANLSTNGFEGVPRGRPAGDIAAALYKAIYTTKLPLSQGLRSGLLRAHKEYKTSISRRNKLLHAHPFTAADGEQQLCGGGFEWPIDAVNEAASFFEIAAIQANTILQTVLEFGRGDS